MKDREELAGKLRSTYFDGNDKADIVKEVKGLKKDVDHDYHVCVAARPSRYSVSILILQPSLSLICRQGAWTPLGRIRSKIAQLHAGEAEKLANDKHSQLNNSLQLPTVQFEAPTNSSGSLNFPYLPPTIQTKSFSPTVGSGLVPITRSQPP